MKKKSKKRLPKYWLGTRMPTSTGRLIGNVSTASYSSSPGEDVTPEVNAMKQNLIPKTLQRLTTNALYPLLALSSYSLASKLGESAGESAAKTAASNAAKIAGTATAALGTAYSAYNLYNDYATANQHRSASDMLKTMTTNTVTTDGGSTYQYKTGLNAPAELAYAKTNKLQKQANHLLDWIGAGASAGTIVTPGLGTLIGALGGAAIGGIGNALGFGDTTDETRKAMAIASDSTYMDNRLGKGLAENQDVRNGYYKSLGTGYGTGVVGAALGKRPVYGRGGKANAKVSNGEWIGNLKDGWIQLVPGKPNNKDTKYARLATDDFVVSNRFVPYALATGDVEGALVMLDMYNKNKIAYKNAPGYIKAKCGKMPKYLDGTIGDYSLSALPHMMSFFSNLALYNRAANAAVAKPEYEVLLSDAPINLIMSDQEDIRPYLNMSNNNFRQAAWNVRHTPAMGLGGRAVMLDSLYKLKMAQDADVAMKANTANRNQRNIGAEMLNSNNLYRSKALNDNFWKTYAALQLSMGQKESWMAKYLNNMSTNWSDLASDTLRTNFYNKALGIQNRQTNIYEQAVNKDYLDYLNKLTNMGIIPLGVIDAAGSDNPYERNYRLGEAFRRAQSKTIV